MDSRIPVGISACLMGEMVRHDGGHKRSRYCTDVLSRSFDLQPQCPEVGAGLGTPRPAMHLVERDGLIRMEEVRGEGEHSQALRDWSRQTLPGLAHLRGFILMQKSPSCGMERVRIYNSAGNVQHRQGRGLFAAALMEGYPLMPVEESGRLNDDHLLERFIERVFVYDDWMRMHEEGGLTAKKLIDFHTRHKFQLLAHDQNTYRRLGPLLSDLSGNRLEAVADEYIQAFMDALARPASRGAHANAMLHLLGYFRGRIDDDQRRTVAEQVDAYVRGEVPLIVPMTLLRLAQRQQPSTYVGGQQYLQPYPDDLGLRNRV